MRSGRVALVLLAGALTACSGSQGGTGQAREDGARVAARDINAVLAAHRDSLMALPGVVGTAIGLCGEERCIKVLLADSSAAAGARIPERLEGYRVVAEVAGTIRPR